MVVVSLSNTQMKGARLSRVLVQKGANTLVLGTYFKAVVKTILIFGL